MTGRTLDDIRSAYPDLGFALYAYEPGGAVTLEVHGLDGKVYPFTGPTEQAVIDKAFPPRDPEPEPAAAPETPSELPTPSTNVFD